MAKRLLILCCVVSSLFLTSCAATMSKTDQSRIDSSVKTAFDGEWVPVKWRKFNIENGRSIVFTAFQKPGLVPEYRGSQYNVYDREYDVKGGCLVYRYKGAYRGQVIAEGVSINENDRILFRKNLMESYPGAQEMEMLGKDLAVLRHVYVVSDGRDNFAPESFKIEGMEYILARSKKAARTGKGITLEGTERSAALSYVKANTQALVKESRKRIAAKAMKGPISPNHNVVFGRVLFDGEDSIEMIDLVRQEFIDGQWKTTGCMFPLTKWPGYFALYNAPPGRYAVWRVTRSFSESVSISTMPEDGLFYVPTVGQICNLGTVEILTSKSNQRSGLSLGDNQWTIRVTVGGSAGRTEVENFFRQEINFNWYDVYKRTLN